MGSDWAYVAMRFLWGVKHYYLISQFTPADVAKLIVKRRPTLVIGVPTLFDALSREPAMQNADLSCLRATFCGADTLPKKVKELLKIWLRKMVVMSNFLKDMD